jgi:hypothetical protein
MHAHACWLLQADQEDLRAFETASASARSQGLFFKNLYQPEQDPQQPDGQGEGAASSSSKRRNRILIDPVAARQAAAAVASSAEDEVGHPFRMYLFGYMAAVLALVVMQGEWRRLHHAAWFCLLCLCCLLKGGCKPASSFCCS